MSVPDLTTTVRWLLDMSGRTVKNGFGATDLVGLGSTYIESERKQLSEASRMQKSSTGFAIAVCAVCETSGNKLWWRRPYKTWRRWRSTWIAWKSRGNPSFPPKFIVRETRETLYLWKRTGFLDNLRILCITLFILFILTGCSHREK